MAMYCEAQSTLLAHLVLGRGQKENRSNNFAFDR